LATLLLEAGRAQDAADTITLPLQREEHANHLEGLLLYARIAALHGKDPEALGVLLRIVSKHQHHRGARALLATVVGKGDGDRASAGKGSAFDLLAELLPLSAASASAYAFLATLVKDEGQVDAACGLLTLAGRAAPADHCYALNLVHAHELRADPAAAFAAAAAHLVRTPTAAVAPTWTGARCAAAVAAMATLADARACPWDLAVDWCGRPDGDSFGVCRRIGQPTPLPATVAAALAPTTKSSPPDKTLPSLSAVAHALRSSPCFFPLGPWAFVSNDTIKLRRSDLCAHVL
jgi:hypothetical protein